MHAADSSIIITSCPLTTLLLSGISVRGHQTAQPRSTVCLLLLDGIKVRWVIDRQPRCTAVMSPLLLSSSYLMASRLKGIIAQPRSTAIPSHLPFSSSSPSYWSGASLIEGVIDSTASIHANSVSCALAKFSALTTESSNFTWEWVLGLNTFI